MQMIFSTNGMRKHTIVEQKVNIVSSLPPVKKEKEISPTELTAQQLRYAMLIRLQNVTNCTSCDK